MLRALILIVLIGGGALLLAPFVLARLNVDRYGVPLPGKVYSKHEYILLEHNSWSRDSEVSFEYTDPETNGARFFGVKMAPARYDSFHKGQPVQLRYLRHENVPKVPGAETLWQMRILPMVQLADEHAFAGLRLIFTPLVTLACEAVLGLIVVLWLWRRARFPGFGWALGVCIVCALILMLTYDFPRPTPAPQGELRHAIGKVQNMRHIDILFSGRRSRGLEAHQPIDVVGVEFVPQGMTDTVLTVDLVDRGSKPDLKEGAPVEVDYEAATPRNAHMRGVTRTFFNRNIIGVAEDLALTLALLLGALFVWVLLGRAWGKLTQRKPAVPPLN